MADTGIESEVHRWYNKHTHCNVWDTFRLWALRDAAKCVCGQLKCLSYSHRQREPGDADDRITWRNIKRATCGYGDECLDGKERCPYLHAGELNLSTAKRSELRRLISLYVDSEVWRRTLEIPVCEPVQAEPPPPPANETLAGTAEPWRPKAPALVCGVAECTTPVDIVQFPCAHLVCLRHATRASTCDSAHKCGVCSEQVSSLHALPQERACLMCALPIEIECDQFDILASSCRLVHVKCIE